MSAPVPNHLFCVGAQKAGTTWLYDYFSAHPQVHVPPVKEMHYFNVLHDPNQAGFYHARRNAVQSMLETAGDGAENRGAQPGDPVSLNTVLDLVKMHESKESDHAAYRRFMVKDAGASPWVADITPAYCTLGPGVMTSMLQAFPGAKMIYILRDPVSRLWSQVQMELRRRRASGQVQYTAEMLISSLLEGHEDHMLARSNYPGTLFALGHLPKDRVKYMFYETLFSDNAMLELCNFLNIGFKPGDYSRRVRAGVEAKMTEDQIMIFRWLLASVYRRVYDAFGNAVPRGWDLSAMDAKRPSFLDVSKIGPHVMSKAG
ncbi:MAG: sulfotransferase [Pseudotabrizicola sp.]|uniref:sulfotransferase family protein n=1 Tax=Pseudotabrizicola sp. TaxID=2939647 RepID=UPI0027320C6E|nr:sulfotransferase [Pseudotabrizicola sp.]MDP2083074.1 sulfotransferase [Pseudotabrizicola sp.]MDZ7572492.1 sulfotransferase [Pseudotabrizicola sp.]